MIKVKETNCNKFINDPIIKSILIKMKDIYTDIRGQKDNIEKLNYEIRYSDISEEDRKININNLKVFKAVLEFYNQRFTQLDMMLSDYCTLLMNESEINSDVYTQLISDFKKRLDGLLGIVEFEASGFDQPAKVVSYGKKKTRR